MKFGQYQSGRQPTLDLLESLPGLISPPECPTIHVVSDRRHNAAEVGYELRMKPALLIVNCELQ